MQIFDSRKYSVKEIKDWFDRDELDLSPNFQRRNVWIDKARSYLIDTILRGKPIPKIFIRLKENPDTGRTIREVVDGQQRLTSILTFMQDGFPINKVHNENFGGKYYSQLDRSSQNLVRNYELTIDLLFDAPDSEIYDIFARLNKYPVKINDQELRNSQYYGEFKTTVYQLANEFTSFWIQNGIFTDKQISRMAEAELTADLLIAMSQGIKAKSKAVINKAFEDFDDAFPSRLNLMKRFIEVMDLIGAIMHESLQTSELRRSPLFYTLFCSIYHMQYGLPHLNVKRTEIKPADVPKVQVALEKIDAIFAVPKAEIDTLQAKEKQFRLATDVHTIHAANRIIRTKFTVDLLRTALQK